MAGSIAGLTVCLVSQVFWGNLKIPWRETFHTVCNHPPHLTTLHAVWLYVMFLGVFKKQTCLLAADDQNTWAEKRGHLSVGKVTRGTAAHAPLFPNISLTSADMLFFSSSQAYSIRAPLQTTGWFAAFWWAACTAIHECCSVWFKSSLMHSICAAFLCIQKSLSHLHSKEHNVATLEQ